MVVGVRGFGVSRNRKRCLAARVFLGVVMLVGGSLLRRKRWVVVVWFWVKGCGGGGAVDKRFLSDAGRRIRGGILDLGEESGVG